MKTDNDAANSGIDSKEIVRDGLIELRDAMLTISRFHESMLLTHAIWWLAEDPADAKQD